MLEFEKTEYVIQGLNLQMRMCPPEIPQLPRNITLMVGLHDLERLSQPR